SWPARYKSCPDGWQQRLTLAFAFVVLDLDLDFRLDVLSLVGEIVGILQRLVTLHVGQFVAGYRRLVGLLLGRGLRGGRCRSSTRRGRRRRTAAAANLHEVLAVVLAAALRTFDRALVQVVEARAAALAGALRAPIGLDHATTP